MPGIALGAVAFRLIPSGSMGPFFGVLLLFMIAMQIIQQTKPEWIGEHVPHQWWFSAITGVLVGFITMVGNVAGSVMGIYLLSMGLEKKKFMGTAAWFAMIVNVIKVPVSAGLGYITGASLLLNLKLAPVILLGVGAGILIFRRIPEKWFTRVILFLATIAALRLLLV